MDYVISLRVVLSARAPHSSVARRSSLAAAAAASGAQLAASSIMFAVASRSGGFSALAAAPAAEPRLASPRQWANYFMLFLFIRRVCFCPRLESSSRSSCGASSKRRPRRRLVRALDCAVERRERTRARTRPSEAPDLNWRAFNGRCCHFIGGGRRPPSKRSNLAQTHGSLAGCDAMT